MSSVDIISPESASTLPALFQERVRRSSGEVAYRYCNRISNKWQPVTWQKLAEQIALWRTALAREQLNPGDRVAIMLPNCTEWVCFDQAALSLGLVVVPLYLNDRPENVAYILRDTKARVFICPGMSCWENLTHVFKELDTLQRVITIDFCQTNKEDTRIVCISDWLPDQANEQTAAHPTRADDTATIVYTSGTTGPPKGVMLSHRNILENAHAGLQCMDIYPTDTFLSFLPLSHMLERTVGYYLPVMSGATVAFARSIPELAEDLLTVRPTVMIAVPRIFERIYSSVKQTLESKPNGVKKLFEAAVMAGWAKFTHDQKRTAWSPILLAQPMLDSLVAKKIRGRLGGRLRIIISGGAPLAADIAQFFISLGLPIYQGYGLTETSPVISVNRIENNNPAGVGLPLPGVEVRLGEFNELQVRAKSVMQGYWQRPEVTADTIDPDGWLRTGDRAEIIDGHIRITGRLKEIIVLSNGEKVSPSDIEMAIALDPLFEQTMVIGEGRPYLALLAVLAKERWQMLAEELGVPADESSLGTAEVEQAILERVEQLLHDFPGYAFIKQVVLSLEPWTVEDGLLTPTLKVRRQNVMGHFQAEIDALYKA